MQPIITCRVVNNKPLDFNETATSRWAVLNICISRPDIKESFNSTNTYPAMLWGVQLFYVTQASKRFTLKFI
jgi:hypothetical protein